MDKDMLVNHDFEEFLKVLNKNLVEYCIVGGYAIAFHDKPRYTKDMDIIVRDTKANAEKVVKAIKEFGFESLDLKIEDVMVKNTIIQLGYEPNRLDILNTVDGVEFNEVWNHKRIGRYGAEEVFVIGLDELIKNKEASKEQRERPEDKFKDMQDLARLEKVKNLKND